MVRYTGTLHKLADAGHKKRGNWDNLLQYLEAHSHPVPSDSSDASSKDSKNSWKYSFKSPLKPDVQPSASLEKELTDCQGPNGDETPLLIAIHRAPSSAVAALCHLSPSSASIPDRHDRLPLHWAASRPTGGGVPGCPGRDSELVLRILIEVYPEGLVKRDEHGRTPLHYIFLHHAASRSVSVVELLCKSVPRASFDELLELQRLERENATSADHDGPHAKNTPPRGGASEEKNADFSADETPIEISCVARPSMKNAAADDGQIRRNNSLRGVDVDDYFGEDDDEKDWDYEEPVVSPPLPEVPTPTKAENATNGSPNGVKQRKVPCNAAIIPDAKHGALPLHYAVMEGASREAIRTVIQAYPDGIAFGDRYNRTPLSWYLGAGEYCHKNNGRITTSLKSSIFTEQKGGRGRLADGPTGNTTNHAGIRTAEASVTGEIPDVDDVSASMPLHTIHRSAVLVGMLLNHKVASMVDLTLMKRLPLHWAAHILTLSLYEKENEDDEDETTEKAIQRHRNITTKRQEDDNASVMGVLLTSVDSVVSPVSMTPEMIRKKEKSTRSEGKGKGCLTLKCLKTIITANHAALVTPDAKGRTPLHIIFHTVYGLQQREWIDLLRKQESLGDGVGVALAAARSVEMSSCEGRLVARPFVPPVQLVKLLLERVIDDDGEMGRKNDSKVKKGKFLSSKFIKKKSDKTTSNRKIVSRNYLDPTDFTEATDSSIDEDDDVEGSFEVAGSKTTDRAPTGELGRSASSVEDGLGRLPLHYALISAAPAKILDLLIKSHPASLLHTTDDDGLGRTPFHMALSSPYTAPLQTSQSIKLLMFFPNQLIDGRLVLKMEDTTGRYPLHLAAENGAPLDVVKLILDRYPQAARCKNEDGDLPLHLLLDKRHLFRYLIPENILQPQSEVDEATRRARARDLAKRSRGIAIGGVFGNNAAGWTSDAEEQTRIMRHKILRTKIRLLLQPLVSDIGCLASPSSRHGMLPLHVAVAFDAVGYLMLHKLLSVYGPAARHRTLAPHAYTPLDLHYARRMIPGELQEFEMERWHAVRELLFGYAPLVSEVYRRDIELLIRCVVVVRDEVQGKGGAHAATILEEADEGNVMEKKVKRCADKTNVTTSALGERGEDDKENKKKREEVPKAFEAGEKSIEITKSNSKERDGLLPQMDKMRSKETPPLSPRKKMDRRSDSESVKTEDNPAKEKQLSPPRSERVETDGEGESYSDRRTTFDEGEYDTYSSDGYDSESASEFDSRSTGSAYYENETDTYDEDGTFESTTYDEDLTTGGTTFDDSLTCSDSRTHRDDATLTDETTVPKERKMDPNEEKEPQLASHRCTPLKIEPRSNINSPESGLSNPSSSDLDSLNQAATPRVSQSIRYEPATTKKPLLSDVATRIWTFFALHKNPSDPTDHYAAQIESILDELHFDKVQKLVDMLLPQHATAQLGANVVKGLTVRDCANVYCKAVIHAAFYFVGLYDFAPASAKTAVGGGDGGRGILIHRGVSGGIRSNTVVIRAMENRFTTSVAGNKEGERNGNNQVDIEVEVLATDTVPGSSSAGSGTTFEITTRDVCIKFLRDREAYEREVEFRSALGVTPFGIGSSDDDRGGFIVPVIDDYDASRIYRKSDRRYNRDRHDIRFRKLSIHGSSVFQEPACTADGIVNISEYPYAIVMPLSRLGDLYDIYVHEGMTDMDSIRDVGLQVGKVLQFMHNEGIVHCNVHMRNIISLQKPGAGPSQRNWFLTDLASATRISSADDASHISYVGAIYPSGSPFVSSVMPPEMFTKLTPSELQVYEEYWNTVKQIENVNIDDSIIEPFIEPKSGDVYVMKCYFMPESALKSGLPPLPYEPLVARETVDIWSFGVMLFTLCSSGQPLFPSNTRTGNLISCEQVANWNQEAAENMIYNHVRDPLAQDLLLHVLVLHDERLVLNMGTILSHPFFTKPDNHHKVSKIMQRIIDQRLLESETRKEKMYAQARALEEERWVQERTVSVKFAGVDNLMRMLHSPSNLIKDAFRATDDSPVIPYCFIVLPYQLVRNKSGKLTPSTKEDVELAERMGKRLLALSKACCFVGAVDRVLKMKGEQASKTLVRWADKCKEEADEVAIEILTAVELSPDDFMDLAQNLVTKIELEVHQFLSRPLVVAAMLIADCVTSILSTFEHAEKGYLYLVDEYNCVPISTGNETYPHEIRDRLSVVVSKSLPFMHMCVMYMRGVAGGVSGLVKLIFEGAYPHIPPSWAAAAKGLAHHLDRADMVSEVRILLDALESMEAETPSKKRKSRVGDEELRFMQSFFQSFDKKNNFADLKRVAEGNVFMWTTPESAEKIEKDSGMLSITAAYRAQEADRRKMKEKDARMAALERTLRQLKLEVDDMKKSKEIPIVDQPEGEIDD